MSEDTEDKGLVGSDGTSLLGSREAAGDKSGTEQGGVEKVVQGGKPDAAAEAAAKVADEKLQADLKSDDPKVKAAAEKVVADKKAADEKTKTDKSQFAPAEYTAFTFPEGIEADPEDVKTFQGMAKSLGLTQVEAQKLVDMDTARQAKAVEQHRAAWTNIQDDWIKQSTADAEYGGANFKPNLALANEFIKTVGGKEAAKIREALEITGATNHPEIVRLLVRAGKLVNEDKVVHGGRPPDAPKTLAERIYGTNK